MPDINTRIKKVRLNFELTQKAFAEKVGVKWYQIKDIEIGKTKASAELLACLCEKFAINPEWLLLGNGIIDRKESESLKNQEIKNFNKECQSLINRFKDLETGLQNIKYLIQIERDSKRLYRDVSIILKTTHDTSSALKEERKKIS